MGLLKEIDEQICKPCRQAMDWVNDSGIIGDPPSISCDEECALQRLWTALDTFRNGTLRDALKLQELL